jgi:tetratricopeptide (TPR) repeat protein
MKKLLYVILLTLLTACEYGSMSSVLDEIDTIIVAEQYKRADSLLSLIDQSKVLTEEDISHYSLLKAQISCLLQKPDTMGLLDSVVIPYYTKINNKEKLAEAYYYKGYMELVDKNVEKAVLCYKQAESLAANSPNKRLNYKIAESLSYVNQISGNCIMQAEYAHKALAVAKSAKNGEWMAYSYYRIAVANSYLGKKDTAYYYMDKTIPLIKYVKVDDQPYFLTNIAFTYKEEQPEIAKSLLQKALSMRDVTSAMEILADIYNKEGRRTEAYQLWKRALAVKGDLPKDNLIYSILSYDIEHGNTDHVCEQIEDIIFIKDSMLHQLRNDTIKYLQMRIDKEIAMHEADQRLIRWQWRLFGMVVIAFALIIYVLIKRYTNRLKFQELESQINEKSEWITKLKTKREEAERQIAELKDTKVINEQRMSELEGIVNDSNETIERLNLEIKQRMDQFSSRVREGRLLFDHIKDNGTTSLWANDDYQKFNEYYERIHTKAVAKLRKRRTKAQLSPHNLFYLILKDIGKTDEEVRDIMGISKEALRTLRFRTKCE